MVMVQMANDVRVGRIRSRRLFQLSRKTCNNSGRDESTEEHLQARKKYICHPHGTVSPAMAMPEPCVPPMSETMVSNHISTPCMESHETIHHTKCAIYEMWDHSPRVLL